MRLAIISAARRAFFVAAVALDLADQRLADVERALVLVRDRRAS